MLQDAKLEWMTGDGLWRPEVLRDSMIILREQDGRSGPGCYPTGCVGYPPGTVTRWSFEGFDPCELHLAMVCLEAYFDNPIENDHEAAILEDRVIDKARKDAASKARAYREMIDMEARSIRSKSDAASLTNLQVHLGAKSNDEVIMILARRKVEERIRMLEAEDKPWAYRYDPQRP